MPATPTTPAVPAAVDRIVAYDLDTLAPIGEIPDTGGNGVAICPKLGPRIREQPPERVHVRPEDADAHQED